MYSELPPSFFQQKLLDFFIKPQDIFWNAEKSFMELYYFLQSAQNILIVSHKKPDPDSLGANLALKNSLKKYGKNTTSACVDSIPKAYQWLVQDEIFLQNPDFTSYDSIICVDCSSESQTGFWAHEAFRNHPRLMVIDHHESQSFFGTQHCVFKDTAASCMILALYGLWANWHFDTSLATPLLFGLYFDTGSFQHSNTSASVLKISAFLLKHTSEHKNIVQSLFRDFSIQKLQLWGLAFERANLEYSPFISTAITLKDYQQTQTNYEDSLGLVSYLSHVQEAKAALFLTEYSKDRIKGSLRSIQTDFEVTSYANFFGGGGHREAAGFEASGSIHIETKWKLLLKDSD